MYAPAFTVIIDMELNSMTAALCMINFENAHTGEFRTWRPGSSSCGYPLSSAKPYSSAGK